jgi:hypothetical protein
MRVAIYQPRFFPQLHYFNRALTSDAFVLLDSAQYTKSLVHLTDGKKVRTPSYQSDTPLKLPNGIHLLTVPQKDHMLPLNQTRIEYGAPWAKKHLAVIKSAYGRSPCFKEVFEDLQALLLSRYESLSEMNIKTFLWGIARISGANITVSDITIDSINAHLARSPFTLKRIVTASGLGVARPDGTQKGTEWTVSICKAIGATEYVHGATAQHGYMDMEFYEKRGIRLVAQDWRCPEYPQQFSEKFPFAANLSIIDLLFNVAGEEAAKVVYSE